MLDHCGVKANRKSTNRNTKSKCAVMLLSWDSNCRKKSLS